MKRTLKLRLGLVLLCVLLTLFLNACASGINKFDAVTYVDGFIKASFLGEATPTYLELVDSTQEEIQADYEDALYEDVDNLLNWYGVEYPTDAYKEEVKELFREIYTHTKYKVISAARQNDGSYSVKVEVEPINIIQLCEAEWDEATKGFYEKYENYTPEQIAAMTDQEREAAYQEYAQLILELCQSKMEEIANEAPQSLVLQLDKDEDGLYGINDDDWIRLCGHIIDWSVPESST